MNGSLLVMALVLAALAGLAWTRGGEDLLGRGLASGGSLLLRYLPLLVVSFLAAGLAEALVPRDWVRGALGPDSGLRGIVVASAAGAVTPGGPFVAFPIAAVLIQTGAAIGPLVAFVSAWSLLGLHRMVAFEVPPFQRSYLGSA